MHHVLADIAAFDRALMDLGGDLRWAPLTAVFVVASAWWVKGPLFVIAAMIRDVRDRIPPVRALAVTAAVILGDLLSTLVKHLVDRHRPPAADALIPLPGSPSFPSGHATTAFAAAAAIGVLCPKLRVPAFGLAAFVALSRVYLGVHFTLDILVGAVLGTLLGGAIAFAARRAMPDATAPAPAH
jgi:undecaprenyl-diphosphatase